MDKDPKGPEEPPSADRSLLPPCEKCRTNRRVVCIDRTDTTIYFSCAECDNVWGIPKSEGDW